MASALKALVFSLLPHGTVIQRKTGHRVYLTFDDGPHPENTPRLLDILNEYNAKATFFVQGKYVVRFPTITQRIADEGHRIAGHSWSHRRLPQWAFREAWDEFNRTKTVIRETTGVETNWYRPPFGWVTLPMLAYAATGRMKLVLWSVDSDDDRTRSVAAILAKGRQVQGGDIFLCHDDNEAILEALPALVYEWRARGLDPRALGDG
jgi:peptidoglycan-N-acetylglucosamine deacetylase